MKSEVSPQNGRTAPSSLAALSSNRQAGGPNRYDASSTGASRVDRRRRCLGDFASFGMHPVIPYAIHPHRQKCANSNV